MFLVPLLPCQTLRWMIRRVGIIIIITYSQSNMTVSAFGLLADTSFDYYMKLVPTIYEDLSGQKQFSYQYTFANKV